MFLKPAKLGEKEIPESILSEDKSTVRRSVPAESEKRHYTSTVLSERRFYIPVSSVSRVFKRVAMSKGGFTGKGLFATMPYLVVVYEDGKEKQCNFKYEDQVDAFVASVKERFPQIKTVSEAAESALRKLRKAGGETSHSSLRAGEGDGKCSGAGKSSPHEASVPVHRAHQRGKEKENV